MFYVIGYHYRFIQPIILSGSGNRSRGFFDFFHLYEDEHMKLKNIVPNMAHPFKTAFIPTSNKPTALSQCFPQRLVT